MFSVMLHALGRLPFDAIELDLCELRLPGQDPAEEDDMGTPSSDTDPSPQMLDDWGLPGFEWAAPSGQPGERMQRQPEQLTTASIESVA